MSWTSERPFPINPSCYAELQQIFGSEVAGRFARFVDGEAGGPGGFVTISGKTATGVTATAGAYNIAAFRNP